VAQRPRKACEPGPYFKPAFPVSEFATNSTCLLCWMRWQPGIVSFCPVTYIRFTKLPSNIKPKVNFASTSVGKTQSSCLLQVISMCYRLSVCISLSTILLSDLKPKHYMPYLSSTVTHIFSVDYWRNIEMCVTGCLRSLKIVPFENFGRFFYSHSITTTGLSCIISEIKW